MMFRPIVSLLPLSLALALPVSAADATGGDDWGKGNLIANADFNLATGPNLPEGWTVVSPNPNLAPEFKIAPGPDGRPALEATGNRRQECFGYVSHKIHFAAGKTYCFRIELQTRDLDDLNRHVVHGVYGRVNGGIFEYRKVGDLIEGESRFPGPDKAGNAEVRLYFRFSPSGKVWWNRVSLQECEPIAPRNVKVACSWGRGDMEHWSQWLDAAGQKKVDIALLPEVFNGKEKAKQFEPLDGPSGKLMSDKAKQWHMYVTGTFYVKQDGLIHNTAPLFDREGKLVGCYYKTELFDVEEDDGATPGTNYPIFSTDFGKLGFMVCYDSWFPEVARLLAYKGAELVLCPNAGYYLSLMPARAADNGLCVGASSLGNPAGIWDSSGAMAGQKEDDPTRKAPTMISGYEKDDGIRMLVANLDLSRRFSPAWHEGPMNSAPGGRRSRSTLMRPIEEDIARESARWWVEPDGDKKAQVPQRNAQ